MPAICSVPEVPDDVYQLLTAYQGASEDGGPASHRFVLEDDVDDDNNDDDDDDAYKKYTD